MVRIKHRYLLVNILYPDHPSPPHPKKSSSPLPAAVPDILQFHRPSPDDLTPQILVRAIREQIVYLYGDYGAGVANTGLLVKYLSPATSTFILRCSRAHHCIVWSALTFMTHLPVVPFPSNQKPSPSKPSPLKQSQGQSCVMHVVRVSGTIRKAEEEVVRRARVAIVRARGEVDGGVFGGHDWDEGGGFSGGGQERGGNEGERGMGLGGGIEDEDDEEEEEDESMDEGG